MHNARMQTTHVHDTHHDGQRTTTTSDPDHAGNASRRAPRPFPGMGLDSDLVGEDPPGIHDE